ncbi:amidase signature domain-containing protein [Whalleya microplaca]|nr:amidase signature domain-containing protein [Whalleya microplaca]
MKGLETMTTTTTIVTIGFCDFILRSEARFIISPLGGPERFVPATAVCCDTAHFGDAEFEAMRADFGRDDVWTEHFLEVLILQSSGTLTVTGSTQHRAVTVQKSECVVVGPHVVHSSSGRLYSVYKLFKDASNAFVRGVMPECGTGRYKWLTSIDRIPIPSRLYYGDPVEGLPLNGMRFGVKDTIDVAGLETGCGSKCYQSLYPAKYVTAPFVSQLLSAGAVMVGKLRCCQWCDGQDPLERLEDVTPTNPRGDGFQKPSGSSSGSAVGAASYPWLDFNVGTDTGGSIRHPAGVNGLYGIRPSHGSVKSSGLICSSFFDTPGIFARSAVIARAASRAMMDETQASRLARPKKIVYKLLYAVEPGPSDPSVTPTFFPIHGQSLESQTAASIILEGFVQKVQQYLRCERQELCIHDLWRDTKPSHAPTSLAKSTGTIYQNLLYPELSRNVIKPFICDYQATHDGQVPFIEPITKARLEYGANVSDADYSNSVEALKTYASWVNETLLPSHYSQSGYNVVPLLIYPQSWGLPRYRDEVTKRDGANFFWNDFSQYSISYCSGCPDFTLPIGEVRFHSRYTSTEEYLPVSISLLGPCGMDSVLLDLIVDLEAVDILQQVDCGSRLWT